MVHVQSQGERSLPWFQMDVSDNIHIHKVLFNPPGSPWQPLRETLLTSNSLRVVVGSSVTML